MTRTTSPQNITFNSLNKYKFIEVITPYAMSNKEGIVKERYSVVSMHGTKFLRILTTRWKKSSNPDYKWVSDGGMEETYTDSNQKLRVKSELQLLNNTLANPKKYNAKVRFQLKTTKPKTEGKNVTKKSGKAKTKARQIHLTRRVIRTGKAAKPRKSKK